MLIEALFVRQTRATMAVVVAVPPERIATTSTLVLNTLYFGDHQRIRGIAPRTLVVEIQGSDNVWYEEQRWREV